MKRWTAEKANAWYAKQPWLMGCNFVPTTAVNDVEMWSRDTFDADTIRRELGWARDIGMNTVRVFLSYTVWKAEGRAFLDHFDEFLGMAAEKDIRVMPILFDDCAFDGGVDPFYGPQPAPVPGVHNSRWVPSPGFAVADDPQQAASCRAYVDAVVGAHKDDDRIVAWDLYNEPGNTGRKLLCLPLLVNVFAWARAQTPEQPLCCGYWNQSPEWDGLNRTMMELSDVINLHAYTPLEETKRLVERARQEKRPIFISEWMHRPNGSCIMDHLPWFKEEKIGVWQWGLVQGKTQTHLSWSTMGTGKPDPNPALWQHDVLYPDGSPYREDEMVLMRKLTK